MHVKKISFHVKYFIYILYIASQGQLEITAREMKEKEFNKKPRWLQLGLPSRKIMDVSKSCAFTKSNKVIY